MANAVFIFYVTIIATLAVVPSHVVVKCSSHDGLDTDEMTQLVAGEGTQSVADERTQSVTDERTGENKHCSDIFFPDAFHIYAKEDRDFYCEVLKASVRKIIDKAVEETPYASYNIAARGIRYRNDCYIFGDEFYMWGESQCIKTDTVDCYGCLLSAADYLRACDPCVTYGYSREALCGIRFGYIKRIEIIQYQTVEYGNGEYVKACNNRIYFRNDQGAYILVRDGDDDM